MRTPSSISTSCTASSPTNATTTTSRRSRSAAPGLANGKPQTSILEANFDPNGSWDYGKFNGVDVRTEGLLDVYTTKFRQHVLSGSHKFSDTVKFDFLHGYLELEPERADARHRAVRRAERERLLVGLPRQPQRARAELRHRRGEPEQLQFAPQDADGTCTASSSAATSTRPTS
jgi:iron complex outermembrane receptor protein